MKQKSDYSLVEWFTLNFESSKSPKKSNYLKNIFLQSNTKKLSYEQVGKDMLRLSKELNNWLANLHQDIAIPPIKSLILSRDKAHLKSPKYAIRVALLMPSEGNGGIDYVTLILAMFLLKSKFPYLLIIPLNQHKPDTVLNQEIKQAGVSLVINGFADRKFLTQTKFTVSDNAYRVIDFQKLKKKSYSIKTIVLKKWRKELTYCRMNHGVKDAELTISAVALFTSGSSGTPKLAVFTWKQFLTAATAANQFFPFNGDKSHAWLVLLPFYHVSGFSLIARVLQSVHEGAGGRLVFANSSRNNTTGWWKAVKQHRITHVSLVTAQLTPKSLLPTVKKYLNSLEFALVGGGPVDAQMLAMINQKIDKVNPPLFRATYGLTESLAQVATYDGENHEYPYKILPGRKVKIFREQIYLHKDTLFSGYMYFPVGSDQNTYALRYPLTKAGWFSTGDLGKKQGERIMVLGRKDRQFISGGENIYPEEIERAIHSFIVEDSNAKKGSNLKSIPTVWARVCVIPLAHKKWGQVPVAILELSSHSYHLDHSGISELTAKALQAFLYSRLERYKVPRKYFSFSDEIKKEFEGIKLLPGKVEQEYRKNPKAFKLVFEN